MLSDVGKGKSKGGKAAKAAASTPKGKSQSKALSKPQGKVAKLPKTKCCVSKDRCQRCPIRMLKEGTLPEGYTVKKRVLVRADGKKATKKSLQKVA